MTHHPLLPAVAVDGRDGLDPDEAAVLAVLLNPDLRAIRAQRAVARAQLVQAGILPNPQLTGSLDVPTGGTTQGTVNGFGFGLAWDIVDVITRNARVRAARENVEQIDLTVAWQEWQTAQAANNLVYRVVALTEQLRLADSARAHLEENAELARRALTRGQLTELEVSAAATAAANAHTTYVTLQQELAAARLDLNRILGASPNEAVVLSDAITLPRHFEPPPQQVLLRGVEDWRLDLVALRHGYLSQEETLRAAVLAQFPKINIGVNELRDTGNVVTTGFGITIELPLFDRNQGQIALARATREQLFYEYARRLLDVRYEISRLLVAIDSLNRKIEIAYRSLPMLERLVDSYRSAVESGQADVLSYYNAWNDLNDRRVQIVALESALVDARTAMEIATGIYDLSALVPEGDESNAGANG